MPRIMQNEHVTYILSYFCKIVLLALNGNWSNEDTHTPAASISAVSKYTSSEYMPTRKPGS